MPLPTFALPSVRDLTASVVVFLVAVPLCLGIALASGVPPEKGLITGIIGGLVVGSLAGSPLQVSGPAAGLAVIVFELVRDFGVSALGPVLLLAGAVQMAAGLLKLGQYFRAISPAVVHGMLAGIGALIVLAQFHVLFDDAPRPNGLDNMSAIPAAFIDLSAPLGATEWAFAVGGLTMLAMFGWDKVKPRSLRLVPGALVGVLLATAVATVLALDIKRIALPGNLFATLDVPGMDDLARLGDPALLIAAFAIAFIASAETLLSAAAVDKMHDGPRTAYNRELTAQGVGNFLCGAAGALPMTGVIVRSSANVQAGAETRWSTIIHGGWILAFVALLPFVLEYVPTAALAGVLVVTGVRLVSLKHARHLFHNYGIYPAFIWAATLVLVVATDLLTGVLVGVGLSLIEAVPHWRRARFRVETRMEDGVTAVELRGRATLIHLPRVAEMLERMPADGPVRLTVNRLAYADHTVQELLSDWVQRRRKMGAPLELVTRAPAEGRLASPLFEPEPEAQTA